MNESNQLIIIKYMKYWISKIRLISFFLFLFLLFTFSCYLTNQIPYLFLIGVVWTIYSLKDYIQYYNRIRKIYLYLRDSNMIENIGKIELSDSISYISTDTCLVFSNSNEVFCFAYSDIDKILKKQIFKKHNEYLEIVLKNGTHLRILSSMRDSRGKEIVSTKEYLLEKNDVIIVDV